jgi:hypothetical protein
LRMCQPLTHRRRLTPPPICASTLGFGLVAPRLRMATGVGPMLGLRRLSEGSPAALHTDDTARRHARIRHGAQACVGARAGGLAGRVHHVLLLLGGHGMVTVYTAFLSSPTQPAASSHARVLRRTPPSCQPPWWFTHPICPRAQGMVLLVPLFLPAAAVGRRHPTGGVLLLPRDTWFVLSADGVLPRHPRPRTAHAGAHCSTGA